MLAYITSISRSGTILNNMATRSAVAVLSGALAPQKYGRSLQTIQVCKFYQRDADVVVCKCGTLHTHWFVACAAPLPAPAFTRRYDLELDCCQLRIFDSGWQIVHANIRLTCSLHFGTSCTQKSTRRHTSQQSNSRSLQRRGSSYCRFDEM